MPYRQIIYGTAPSQLIASRDRLEVFVRELVQSLGMTLLGQPAIHDVPLEVSKLGRDPFEDEGGISVLAALSTSHIALHTWPLRNEFHLDVYSCREFKAGTVERVVRGYLQPFNMLIEAPDDGYRAWLLTRPNPPRAG